MKKQLMIVAYTTLTFFGAGQPAKAQVKGVGYTLSPIGEKVWWDKNSGLKDGYMLGGQFGFSFGEYVELRGLYMEGIHMQRNFSAYGIAPEELEDADLSLNRWGGDLKLNLSRGTLLPYLTVGTGVQTTRLGESDKNKQIYFSGGLGIMLSVSDRFTLGLQALRTSFRSNPVNSLLTPEERMLAGLKGNDFDYSSMNNWSGRASILLYLGGRRPRELSEIDRAYMDTFSSGLKGISLPIEPVIGKFDWADNLPYKNTAFGGIATGLDFGPLVGIRAYYLRSFEDKLFSEFDKLEIWGGEGKFKLASSGGLLPFLTAGGGRINVLNGYTNPGLAVTDTMGIDGRGFASGGAGFDLALSRNVKLSAFARAMLTSSHESVVENISSPDELSTSWLYGASINFIIGKKPEIPDKRKEDSYDTQVRADLEKEKRNTQALRKEYQEKLNELDREMDEAYDSGDGRKMAEKYEERQSLKRMISRLDDAMRKENEANGESDALQMNPSELRSLVDEIRQSQKRNEENIRQALEIQNLKSDIQWEKLSLRLRALEESMKNPETDELSILREQLQDLRSRGEREAESDNSEAHDLRRELKELRESRKQVSDSVKSSTEEQRELEALRKEIDELKKEKETKDKPEESSTIRRSAVSSGTGAYISDRQLEYRSPYNDTTGTFFGKMFYEGASAIVGLSLGGNPTFNIGLRQHYRFNKSDFFFMPETFFGFGDPASFGIFANALYQFRFKQTTSIEPYAGIGVGLMQVGIKGDQKLKGATNLVFGAYLFRMGGGRFYADWSARNFFQHNQLALGYRLPF